VAVAGRDVEDIRRGQADQGSHGDEKPKTHGDGV
jgi:hypothetical protein